MAEYKNTDEIVKNMTKKFDKNYGDTTIKGIRDVFNMCVNCVNQTPTADVVEVKRGKWEKIKKLFVAVNPYRHTCGLCGKSYFDHNKFNYPYCPNCGADMRGENNDL